MILNDKSLPYNARVSGGEILLEFKPDGQTFNLNKLTPADGGKLASRLQRWAVPASAPSYSRPAPKPANEPIPENNPSATAEEPFPSD